MPTKKPKKSSSGLSGGQVAGIVIGVLAGVALLIFGYSYYQKKYNSNAKAQEAISAFDKLDEEDDDEDTQL